MRYFIYELIDPRTNTTFYVGVTNNPNMRLTQHLNDTKNVKKVVLIQKLQAVRLEPRMNILEIVNTTRRDALERERYWIEHYLSMGTPITNAQHSLQERRNQGEMQPSGDYYTAKQVLELLHISYSKLHDLVENGNILRIAPDRGKQGYYSKSDVHAVAEAWHEFYEGF